MSPYRKSVGRKGIFCKSSPLSNMPLRHICCKSFFTFFPPFLASTGYIE